MKYAFVLALLLTPNGAWANNCTNADAVAEAKIQLGNQLDLSGADEDAQLSLTDVASNTLTDGTPVCTGRLSNPKFSTISVWSVTYEAGEPVITVIQALTPAYTTMNNNYQQQQDQEAAQVQANQQREQQEEQQQQQSRQNTGLGSLLFGNGLNNLLKGN